MSTPDWFASCKIIADRGPDSTWWAVHSPDGQFYLDENDRAWKPTPQAMAGWFMSEASARNALAECKTLDIDEPDSHPPVPYDQHEREMGQLMDERDAAEQSLSHAYFLVTGRSPEWSNLFGYKEAMQEIDDAMRTLRHAARRNIG